MRAGRARRRQAGFSLLELVVVIAIVALVIAQILPRLEKTLKSSHETAVKLGARALHDGIERARAIQMLNGQAGATYNLARFGDGTLDLSPGGFPAGTSRRPGDRLSAAHCAEIWRALLDAGPAQSDGKLASHYRAQLAAAPGKSGVCVYSYEHGGNMSIRYDPTSGKVWADARFKGSALTE